MKPNRHLLAFALSACLVAAAHAAGPPAPASSGVQPCAAGEACAPVDAGIAAAADLLVARAGAHRLLLIGEMHGTRESPALVARLAERYAQQGPVLVALELSSSIDEDVQHFLSSDGGPDARAALLQQAYWHKPKERSDGRRNFEVIELLERLRALRAQGKAVSVRTIDVGIDQPLDAERRDQAMAGRIREAFLALPAGARLLALTGNVHAMKAKPLFAPPEMQTPMGSLLLDLDPYAVRIVAGGGQFWACMAAVCGPRAELERPAVSMDSSDPSYDFLLAVSRFTLARLIPE